MRKILAMTATAGFAFAGLAAASPTAAHAAGTYAVASDPSGSTTATKTVSAECYGTDKALNYDISANDNGNAAMSKQPQAILVDNCPKGWTATFVNPGARIVVTCFGSGTLS